MALILIDQNIQTGIYTFRCDVCHGVYPTANPGDACHVVRVMVGDKQAIRRVECPGPAARPVAPVAEAAAPKAPRKPRAKKVEA